MRATNIEPGTLMGAERWMRPVLAEISDGVVGMNTDGEVTFMNHAAQELTGWREAEAMGQPVRVVFRDEAVRDPAGNSNVLSEEEEAAGAGEEQALLISRQGSESLIAKRCVNLRDPQGGVAGSVLIFRDITGQLRAARNQERILAELRRANESLKQFSYSSSHDLQEPLRTVAIYSQLLSRRLGPGADEKTTEYLSYVVHGARRMEAFVKALTAYTEAGAAEVVSPLEQVDCKSALDAALASLRPAIEDSGAQIVTGELPIVQAHSVHILQLFQNLISNAIRYGGEKPPWIEISANRHHREWEFSVSDNGIGIPARYHSQVFGIFTRLDARGSPVRTGIGLAICKRIVERYRGRIWVESKEDRGSVFYFTIPGETKPGQTGDGT
jgi:PAS domain S-box-containing protein